MRLPGAVDVRGHLDHAPRNQLGVEVVGRKVATGMTIIAAFLWSDPERDRSHQTGEFGHTEVAEHLHILVNARSLGPFRRYRGQFLGDLMQDGGLLHQTGIVDLHGPGAAKAELLRVHGRALAGSEQQPAERGDNPAQAPKKAVGECIGERTRPTRCTRHTRTVMCTRPIVCTRHTRRTWPTPSTLHLEYAAPRLRGLGRSAAGHDGAGCNDFRDVRIGAHWLAPFCISAGSTIAGLASG